MYKTRFVALVTLAAIARAAHADACSDACDGPLPPVPVLAPAPAPASEVWEERRNHGLMTAGLVIFGTTYTATAVSALPVEQPRLAIPLLGPILVASSLRDDWFAPINRSLAVVTVVLQAGGLVMTIAGAATHRRVRVWR